MKYFTLISRILTGLIILGLAGISAASPVIASGPSEPATQAVITTGPSETVDSRISLPPLTADYLSAAFDQKRGAPDPTGPAATATPTPTPTPPPERSDSQTVRLILLMFGGLLVLLIALIVVVIIVFRKFKNIT